MILSRTRVSSHSACRHSFTEAQNSLNYYYYFFAPLYLPPFEEEGKKKKSLIDTLPHLPSKRTHRVVLQGV